MSAKSGCGSATYSGLFITHGAAPGRIALSFLCFLMVLNNLHAVHAKLPALSANESVWLIDFLIGTTIFNFSLLVEYAMVNYVDDKKKFHAKKPAAHETASVTSSESGLGGRSAPPAGFMGRTRRRLSQIQDKAMAEASAAQRKILAGHRSNLDQFCWWAFPLSYGVFALIMISMWSSYDHLDRCECKRAPCANRAG